MTASITARQGFVGRLFESMKNNDKGRCLVLFLNKKKLFQLDRRLQTCASMVRENHVLADIGTDHAYLPIWLVKKEEGTIYPAVYFSNSAFSCSVAPVIK